MKTSKLYAKIRLQVALGLARDLQRGDFSRFVDNRGRSVYNAADCCRNIRAICADQVVANCFPAAAAMLRRWALLVAAGRA